MRPAFVAAFALAFAAAPAPAASQTADPVGDYTWSFAIQDDVVHGTMKIVRADTGYRATFTSDHANGTVDAQWVKVDGNHVTAYVTGDFGQFTVDMDAKDDALKATYKLVTQDGPMSGPLTVERAKTSSGSTT